MINQKLAKHIVISAIAHVAGQSSPRPRQDIQITLLERLALNLLHGATGIQVNTLRLPTREEIDQYERDQWGANPDGTKFKL
jgi:hypothetical protein